MRFVLVHGGLHGAWCWQRVIPELEARGHEAIAPDLPGHGTRQGEVATLDGYRDAIVDVMEAGDVLVGHSMGCPIITMAADVAPEKVRHLIYLNGPVPYEGKTIAEAVIGDSDPRNNGSPISAMNSGAKVPGTDYDKDAFWFTEATALGAMLYNDCSPEDQQWAFEHVQPQPNAPVQTPIHLERFWTSSIPRSYVACLDDETPAKWDVESRVRRLGIRVAFQMWASHSPFASRPADLAELFVDIVEQPIGADPEYPTVKAEGAAKQPVADEPRPRFVLVHGGMHNAWFWHRLIPELEALGHEAIAVDLPGHGSRRGERATLKGYRDAVVDVLQPGDVLVGHSMGGSVITVAADAALDKVGHMIYLGAPVPIEGKTIAEAVTGHYALPGVEYDDESFWTTDAEGAAGLLFHDLSPEDRNLAFEHLQPQPSLPVQTPITLERFWDSAVPKSYVVCLEDATPARSRDLEGGLERLGLRVIFPFRSSHDAFLSRPRDLARLFSEIVTRPVVPGQVGSAAAPATPG